MEARVFLSVFTDFKNLFSGNYIALILIVAGLVLFILEFFEPSHAILHFLGLFLMLIGTAFFMVYNLSASSLFFIVYFCCTVIICGFLTNFIFWRKRWLKNVDAYVLEREAEKKVPNFYFLLNQEGVAANNIRPSGKAVVNDELYEVECTGGYINQGGKLKVVEVEGSKIYVKGLPS